VLFFSESSVYSRPYVIDFDTGFHAAIISIIRGWKDGINDLINTPRIGYERHGKLGGVAGTLVGLANGILKPVVGTLASLTWFCRGIYANINNKALADKGLEASPINTLGLDSSSSTTINRAQKQDSNNIHQAASKISGFSPEICQQIISEFDNIKKESTAHRFHQHKSQ
jgi:hypothetical protein